jgi:ribonuclease BN (tRNA processing enzyme)
VHQVADLGYLGRHGTDAAELERMAALHTDVNDVGGVAERAGVQELILTHYLPADPAAIPEAEWAQRAAQRFSGTTTARAGTGCGVRSPAPARDHAGGLLVLEHPSNNLAAVSGYIRCPG